MSKAAPVSLNSLSFEDTVANIEHTAPLQRKRSQQRREPRSDASRLILCPPDDFMGGHFNNAGPNGKLRLFPSDNLKTGVYMRMVQLGNRFDQMVAKHKSKIDFGLHSMLWGLVGLTFVTALICARTVYVRMDDFDIWLRSAGVAFAFVFSLIVALWCLFLVLYSFPFMGAFIKGFWKGATNGTLVGLVIGTAWNGINGSWTILIVCAAIGGLIVGCKRYRKAWTFAHTPPYS